MSIYKHTYRPYTGKVTPGWARIVALARYGLAEAWSTKFTTVLFVFCLLPLIGFLFTIYLSNNPAARLLMGNGGSRVLAIDGNFFLNVLTTQSWMAMALSSWIAPRLITLDLVDNALPILLSQSHLALPAMCWASTLLFLPRSRRSHGFRVCCSSLMRDTFHASAMGSRAISRIAFGMLAGAVIWIAFLSLLRARSRPHGSSGEFVATGVASLCCNSHVPARRRGDCDRECSAPNGDFFSMFLHDDVVPLGSPAWRPQPHG